MRSFPEVSGVTPTKSVFFENLDGFRFLCFLSVFFYHSFHTEYDHLKETGLYQFVKFGVFANGNLGVNFFFVLSGFLITYLLISERDRRGRVSIPKFWMRRILRIWPLFYFCVFFGFIVFPFIKSAFGMTPMETADPIFYLTFLNNFDFISNGQPDSSVLGVLWSVAIEEQFYFFWPIALAILPVRAYPYFFSLLIGGTLIFRASHVGAMDNGPLFEMHTFSCIGDMTIGGMGAFLVLRNGLHKWFAQLPRIIIIAFYVAFASVYFFREQLFFHGNAVHVIERSLIAVLILCLIMEQNYSRNSLFKLSRYPRISALGRVSYGLYCLHFIAILITTTLNSKLGFNTALWQVMILETTLALSLSILIATISYKYWETPFLLLKERFSAITAAGSKVIVVEAASSAPTETVDQDPVNKAAIP